MNQKVNIEIAGRASRLPEAVKTSLRALKEHSRELVFETRGQAARSLVRAHGLDRYTAHEHVLGLMARGLIRFEKRTQEELQPRLLEIIPADARSVRLAPPRLTKLD